jgi:hypothetical protein
MFQMLVLANGQRNLLRVPGGVADGLGALVGLDVALAVGMEVAVAVGCGVLVSAGDVAWSPGLGVASPAAVPVPVGLESAWPQPPRATSTPANSATSRPCRAPNTRDRGCTPDSNVLSTST